MKRRSALDMAEIEIDYDHKPRYMFKVIADGDALAHMAQEVREWCERKEWRKPGDHSTPDALGRTLGDEIALLHSEASEALEAYRIAGLRRAYGPNEGPWTILEPGQPYPEGEKPQGVPSELADLLIRLLDTAEHIGIDLFAEYRSKMDYNETREIRHGGKTL